MRRATLLAVFTLLSAQFVAAADKTKLVLEISAPKEIYPDETLAVTATILNTGKDVAHVVRAIDGSFDNLRSVVGYKWLVKKNGEALSRRTDIRRIDNFVNPLAGDDLLQVKPGKTVDPLANGFGPFGDYYDLRTPGKYSILLKYELNPTGREKTGPGGDKALEVIKDQPAVLLESEPVEVTVLPFPPAVSAAVDRVKLAEAKLQIVRQFAEGVAKNPNSTAEERDAAAERLKRAGAARDEATAEHEAKLAEFRKKRDEERKKK